MQSEDVVLRGLTIVLFVIWRIIWVVAEQRANKEKPKTRNLHSFEKQSIERYIVWCFYLLLLLQLSGIPFLTLPLQSFSLRVVGFVVSCIGFFILLYARNTLDTNWTNAWEHQIKQSQQLVSDGIYAYIRHPIYFGALLYLFGAELVVNSYVCLIVLGGFLAVYIQGKREEKILIHHFGRRYTEYMKRTKMLIPFVL